MNNNYDCHYACIKNLLTSTRVVNVAHRVFHVGQLEKRK